MTQFWNSDPDAIFWLEETSFFWVTEGVAYAYNQLGWLTTAVYAAGFITVFSYDSVGNRTSVVTTASV